MVKIMKITQENNNKIIAELFADSKADSFDSIEGLSPNFKLSAGSSVITANGDFAFLRSDGIWNWI